MFRGRKGVGRIRNQGKRKWGRRRRRRNKSVRDKRKEKEMRK